MTEGCTHLFFEALASPLRLSIVELLLERSATVTEIADEIGAEQSRVSHALTALLDCKLISCTKEGKNRIYTVTQPFVGEIINMVKKYGESRCKTCARLKK